MQKKNPGNVPTNDPASHLGSQGSYSQTAVGSFPMITGSVNRGQGKSRKTKKNRLDLTHSSSSCSNAQSGQQTERNFLTVRSNRYGIVTVTAGAPVVPGVKQSHGW